MANFEIRKDLTFRVPTSFGHLDVCPHIDTMHHFAPIGAWILKYFDSKDEPPRMKDVVMDARSAEWLITICQMDVLERTFMTTSEHQHYLDFQQDNLQDLDFEAEEPDEDIN